MHHISHTDVCFMRVQKRAQSINSKRGSVELNGFFLSLSLLFYYVNQYRNETKTNATQHQVGLDFKMTSFETLSLKL